MILLLSAPVQQGKTTALINWSAGRNNVSGILTPVIDGKRFFMNVRTRETWPMEAGAAEQEPLKIGRFVFSKTAFEKAIATIQHDMEEEGWLLIDEIGPLELRGEGFCKILKEIVVRRSGNLLLVVREGLTDAVINYFGIPKATVVSELPSGV